MRFCLSNRYFLANPARPERTNLKTTHWWFAFGESGTEKAKDKNEVWNHKYCSERKPTAFKNQAERGYTGELGFEMPKRHFPWKRGCVAISLLMIILKWVHQ